ncbi:MAG: signal peptidase II [Anaerovoracaceae bacterium]|jgi:signal peptidase II
MYYFVIIGILIIVDQFTKYIIQSNLDLNQSVSVIEGVFHITYIHNYGAAFSILEGKQGFFIAVTSVVIIAIIVYIVFNRHNAYPLLLVSLSLISGGGIGNLINRIQVGYVVDFLDFRIWPIFNVADIAVCCGCLLILIYMFFIEPKLKKDLPIKN